MIVDAKRIRGRSTVLSLADRRPKRGATAKGTQVPSHPPHPLNAAAFAASFPASLILSVSQADNGPSTQDAVEAKPASASPLYSSSFCPKTFLSSFSESDLLSFTRFSVPVINAHSFFNELVPSISLRRG